MDVELYCDSTEPREILDMLVQSAVPAERRSMVLHPKARPETLDANPLKRCGGDYAFFVGGRPAIGIERKQLRDAVMSIMPHGRRPPNAVFRQLESIKAYPIRILLLEGQLPQELRHFESVLFGLQYWCLRNGIFVFHTSGREGTAIALKIIYRSLRRSVHHTRPRR